MHSPIQSLYKKGMTRRRYAIQSLAFAFYELSTHLLRARYDPFSKKREEQ
jgi:hypothetical protein